MKGSQVIRQWQHYTCARGTLTTSCVTFDCGSAKGTTERTLCDFGVCCKKRILLHPDHDIFVRAIQDKRKVKLTFFSKEQALNVVRLCAAMYYSRGQTEGDDLDCYYFWDFESAKGKRFLSFPPSQIANMELTEEPFDLVEFFTSGRQNSNS